MRKTTDKISTLLEKILVNEPKIQDVRYQPKTGRIVYHSSLNGVGGIKFRNNDNNTTSVFPELNIKGTVGYGGGGFDVSQRFIVGVTKNGEVLGQELHEPHGSIQIYSGAYRFADPKISPDEKHILTVFDLDGKSGIGFLRLQENSGLTQKVQGADFHMHPAWHPDGKLIAWVEWDHPYMPWDASRVMAGQFSAEQPGNIESNHIAGREGMQASQPRFSPDGKWLSFIQRNGNWDNLVLLELSNGQKMRLLEKEEIHLSLPDWVQGQRTYSWNPDGRSLTCIGYRNAVASLIRVNVVSGETARIPSAPYSWISQIDSSPAQRSVVFTGSSHGVSGEIVEYREKKFFPVLNKSQADHPPVPKEIVVNSGGGTKCYAWYYPPTVEADSPPPCVVKFHSGPTAAAHPGYSKESVIFTSMGYAIVYLNYRGSVTYGYDFQNMLRRAWGDVETEDAHHLVNYLTAHDLADPEKIVVLGSSAGGFSLLHMLIRYPGRFKAGICSYAVSDLVDDAENTHKFEKYYHRFLTGNYPEEKQRFIDRSPITHVDRITDPLALFHGADDPVVSPAQSEIIFTNLKSRGIPTVLKIYKDEGHGFNKKETLLDYYQTVFMFLDKNM